MTSALLKASRSAEVGDLLATPEHAGQRFDRHAEKQGDDGENEDDLDQGEAARTVACAGDAENEFSWHEQCG